MTTQRPERRARTVALTGLIFEVLLAAFFAILMVWSQSEAIRALTLFAGIGVPVWLFLVLVYHQRVLVQDEALETEQLQREQAGGLGGGAIFEVDQEQLLLAQRRLSWMYRWMLPFFTILIFGLLALAGLFGWAWPLGLPLSHPSWPPVRNPELLIWFVGGAAFISFLLSRYATGMGRQPEWRMLRCGSGWLMGITLSAVAIVATLAPMHYSDTAIPERVLAKVLRVLLLVLAGEVTLNFVVDFYRPRAPGEEPRPAFDSRVLGLFTEPGGIARSIAEAINYQFGFEVSSTWFYKLLQRSVVPLIGFAVLTLFAASCVVFIEADEQAVIERFGLKIESAGDGNGVLGPGPHLKYPWPIDKVYKVATQRVHELKIGEKTDKQQKQEEQELILWTNKHESDPHLQVLVATPKLAEFMGAGKSRPAGKATSRPVGVVRTAEPGFAEAGEAVPVSLLRVSVVLQYRIRNAWDWLTTFEQPEGMLEMIAKSAILRYCAGIDVNNLLGGQRKSIEKSLWQTIQDSTDESKLGVDIVFLGLQGVHPPEETAEQFQDVIGAVQKKMAAIHSAQSDYKKRLTEAAGDVGRAEQLADAIRQMNQLEGDEKASTADRDKARNLVQTLFMGNEDENIVPAGGEAAGLIASAAAKRWELENKAHGEAMKFLEIIASKNAAPRVYYLRKYLDTLAETVSGVRKYVIAAGGEAATRVFQLNLQDPSNPALDFELDSK